MIYTPDSWYFSPAFSLVSKFGVKAHIDTSHYTSRMQPAITGTDQDIYNSHTTGQMNEELLIWQQVKQEFIYILCMFYVHQWGFFFLLPMTHDRHLFAFFQIPFQYKSIEREREWLTRSHRSESGRAVTSTARRECRSLRVTVAATPQSLATTDLGVSQGICDILFVTRLALSFCDRVSPSSHHSIFRSHIGRSPPSLGQHCTAMTRVFKTYNHFWMLYVPSFF